jgi:beta-phosphoglucomutase-like phosphatase (HAD superfamily)
MERLGATEAIAFEDSAAGLASARAAGCRVVEVRHASELPELLQRVIGELSQSTRPV